jgi:hypothetical protein
MDGGGCTSKPEGAALNTTLYVISLFYLICKCVPESLTGCPTKLQMGGILFFFFFSD